MKVGGLAGQLNQFQSTRPRGARPNYDNPRGAFSIVSIHAPARGATIYLSFIFFDLMVSIHAPARGATENDK